MATNRGHRNASSGRRVQENLLRETWLFTQDVTRHDPSVCLPPGQLSNWRSYFFFPPPSPFSSSRRRWFTFGCDCSIRDAIVRSSVAFPSETKGENRADPVMKNIFKIITSLGDGVVITRTRIARREAIPRKADEINRMCIIFAIRTP